MSINLDLVRVGDQLHIVDGIVEISKPIKTLMDGSHQIWGFKGDLFGVIDYDTELEINPSQLQEMVTKGSLLARLKATPQYQAGLKDGWEEMLEFIRSKAFAWYDGPEQAALLNIAVAFERDLDKRYK